MTMTFERGAAGPTASDTADERDPGWQLKVGMIALVLAAAAVGLSLSVFHAFLPPLLLESLAPLLSTIVALMLAGFPLVIGFVQAISRDRQLRKLVSIASWPVASTTYYAVALSNLRSLRPASVTQRDYRFPMICFCFTIVLCSLSVFLCYSFPETTRYRSVILGGAKIIGMDDGRALYDYQAGTFTMIAYAFFGAYLSVITRLLGRISNNDVYPISFHNYTAWILSAGLIGGVLRHLLDIFGITLGSSSLVLVGFVVGLSPNLFVVAIARRVFDLFNLIGDKRDPDKAAFPTNLSLLMIDGITTDQIDRLAELGVTNAQLLAAQNPFVLWPRLPYDLALLVNWVAQAQLYVKLREGGLRIVRDNQIDDIFDFSAALADPASQATLCTLLKLPGTLAPPLLSSLEADPCFARLKAVRVAMTNS